VRELRPTPDVFAAVMATGILSIAAADHHYRWISLTLAVIAAVGLVVLVGVVVWQPPAFGDISDPDILLRLYTFVAACAVLGARFAWQPVVIRGLGAVALLAWLVLTPLAVRAMRARGWTGLRDGAHGAWELAAVGTAGLAIVGADLGMVVFAATMWVLALAVYCLMTGLILWRTVHERLDRKGFEPDSWILMGGLAITTLAGDHIHEVAHTRVVEAVTVVTWLLATLWIPPLVYFGIQRINRHAGALRFAGVWWAMVFPLGMYSSATHSMAVELGVRSLRTVSLVFFWVALAVWLIVALAGFRRVWVR
jgi:tellurite resistance protein TehA-like permease